MLLESEGICMGIAKGFDASEDVVEGKEADPNRPIGRDARNI